MDLAALSKPENSDLGQSDGRRRTRNRKVHCICIANITKHGSYLSSVNANRSNGVGFDGDLGPSTRRHRLKNPFARRRCLLKSSANATNTKFMIGRSAMGLLSFKRYRKVSNL